MEFNVTFKLLLALIGFLLVIFLRELVKTIKHTRKK